MLISTPIEKKKLQPLQRGKKITDRYPRKKVIYQQLGQD